MGSYWGLPGAALEYVVDAGWQGALLALGVLIISGALRGRLPARWHYALWMVVIARLALPAVQAAPWSLSNLPGRIILVRT
jgi:beta-lactamase regulating signal transducer with metallopeptidase domain